MRLVRIDRIAPGGATLDLHPRMTVLQDAPPELRRRLVEVFRSFSDDAAPGHGGTLEVSGVRLTLDRATLDQLQLDPHIDAVLRFDAEHPDPAAAAPGPSTEWTAGDPAVGRPSAAELRSQLRAVAARRTQLAERMEEHRSDLDPHATTAVDVCVGQIEAMESRRSILRADWERERARRAEARDELLARRAAVHSWIERAERIDPTPVQAAADALARAVEPPSELDPVAVQLADRLEGLLTEARELAARRATLQLHEREASQRLDEAVEAARSAERAMRTAVVDPEVVARLEQVRDEIFSVGDRSSRLGSSRNKRRVSELRAEEAVLLDRLGYDTYSAYVMGIPSLRAEMERISLVDSAQTRSERIEAEVEQLRADLPDRSDVDRAANELSSTLVESLSYLGDPRALSLSTSSDDPDDVEQLAELVYATTEELRHRRVAATAEDSPQVVAAVDRLRRVLIDAASDGPDASGPGAAETIPVGPFPNRAMPTTSTELLEVAAEWFRWHDRVVRVLGPTRARLAQLDVELAALESSGEPSPDMVRWAELEAELDAALDRLTIAEERVRVHEVASASIAELREQELSVRDEERTLLAAIAEADRPAAATPPPYRPGSQQPAPATATATDGGPPPVAPAMVSSGTGTGTAAWQVVSRLAEQRSVSFAGSVPVLVDGLPSDRGEARAVAERLQAMSDLIQVVLLVGSSDPAVEVIDRSMSSVASF